MLENVRTQIAQASLSNWQVTNSVRVTGGAGAKSQGLKPGLGGVGTGLGLQFTNKITEDREYVVFLGGGVSLGWAINPKPAGIAIKLPSVPRKGWAYRINAGGKPLVNTDLWGHFWMYEVAASSLIASANFWIMIIAGKAEGFEKIMPVPMPGTVTAFIISTGVGGFTYKSGGTFRLTGRAIGGGSFSISPSSYEKLGKAATTIDEFGEVCSNCAT
ncbi:MAG: hypothetical protein DWQ47_02820 [Acidobacteria bacterium]|nr:MAG: hypothetical protein DWQ32_06370 [Acidobacteriota bacterium]REK01340.1 MAG: hypothetical protein DWQ38_02805 [Acidobacteriota bacterium]REK14296.1 MAG: hypothetical protein DWQ43_12060 [Acidobacteriota bacterium]REK45011.1 MAG: hypothetical protein DWQ47_02820 [Acidobacteriota bacterium]